MPKRTRVRQLKGGPQGDDAIAVIVEATIIEKVMLQITMANCVLEQGREKLLSVFIADHLIGWNWVDDDDISLPQPNADIIFHLTTTELDFIAKAIGGLEDNQGENESEND